MYWASWKVLRTTLPVMLAAVAWYAWMHLRARRAGSRGVDSAATFIDAADWRGGAWLLVYLALTYLLSLLSTRGGLGWFSEGWGSLLTAAMSLACYAWGVRAGRRYVRARRPGFA
jgi:hypothetical protein